MAKLVCHAEKYKKGSVSSIERHNERKNMNYSNEEIDPSRTHLNYSLPYTPFDRRIERVV